VVPLRFHNGQNPGPQKRTMAAAVEDDAQQREKLNAVLEYWTTFDLDGRRQKMDNQCLELREAKEVTETCLIVHKWP
jgi:hypothetical protein